MIFLFLFLQFRLTWRFPKHLFYRCNFVNKLSRRLFYFWWDAIINKQQHIIKISIDFCTVSWVISFSSTILQVPRAATYSSTIYRKNSEMQSSCKCSCPSVTSSAPRSSSTELPIRASASVSVFSLYAPEFLLSRTELSFPIEPA